MSWFSFGKNRDDSGDTREGDLREDPKFEGAVRNVLQRIETSTLLEDKIDAMERLLDWSREDPFRHQFGKEAFLQIALTLLERESQENIEVLRQLLETIHNLVSIVTSHDDNHATFRNAYLDVIVAHDADQQLEKFLSLLLSLLNEHASDLAQDYYVKYYVTQIINLVLRKVDNIAQDETFLELARIVQQTMLRDAGVLNLVPLVKGTQEILRNEGLILFDTLTRVCTRWSQVSGQSSELPKIIAFEGIFERLFQIISEETGNISGALIVEHCMHIMYNLLHGNSMNQRYFCEIGCINHLYLLLSAEYEALDTPSSVRVIFNVLNVVQILVEKDSDNLTATKDTILKSNLLDALITIALSSGFTDENFNAPTLAQQQMQHLKLADRLAVSDEVEIHAMHVLGSVLYQHRPSQEFLESKLFEDRGEHLEGALVRLVRTALYEHNELKQQTALSCLLRFLDNNEEGQFAIATTMKAPKLITSGAEEAMLCGISLASAIFGFAQPRHTLYESYYATVILRTILEKNDKCKTVLLEIPYEIKQGRPSISFFDCVVRSSIQSIKSRADEVNCIGLLLLLCVWITDSPDAAKRFASQTSNVVFFLELVTTPHIAQNTSIHVVGLAALLLGIIALDHPEPSDDDAFSIGGYDKESLVDVLLQRVGLKRISEQWQRLCSSEPFKQAFVSSEQHDGKRSVYDAHQAQFCINTYRRIESFLEDEELTKKQQDRKAMKNDIHRRRQQKQDEGAEQQTAVVDHELGKGEGTILEDDEVQQQDPAPTVTALEEEQQRQQSAFSNMIDEKVISRYKELVKEQEELAHQWQQKHDEIESEHSTLLKREDELVERIALLEKQLIESHERGEHIEGDMKAKEEEHRTLQDELQEKLKEKDAAMIKLGNDHTAELEVMRQSVDDLHEELDQKAREMEMIQQSFGEMEEAMHDRDEELRELREQTRERGSRVSLIEQENQDLIEQTARLKHQMEQMERERGQSNAELELSNQVQQRTLHSLQEQLSQAHAALAERDSEKETLHQELIKSRNEMEILQQQMNQQHFQITQQLEAAQRTLQERETTAQQQSSTMHHMQLQEISLRESCSALQQQLSHLEQQKQHLEQELQRSLAQLEQQQQLPSSGFPEEERAQLQMSLLEKEKKIEDYEGDLEDMMAIIENLEKQLKERE